MSDEKAKAEQQALPLQARGPTLKERGPREKLYVIPVNGAGYIHMYSNRSAKATFADWTVTFTRDAEAARKIRKYFPLSLSTVKRLIRRCHKHDYFGTTYSSWRYHPCGFADEVPEDVISMLGLVALIEHNGLDKLT